MNDLIANPANPGSPVGTLFPEVTSYGPVGSSGGENAMDADQQELAPMSRFMRVGGADTHGCRDPQVNLAQAGCWEVARDALSVIANDGTCDALVVGPGTNGWRTVLRQIFAGQGGSETADNVTAPIATRCNNADRLNLVNNWSNLFQGGCAAGTCTGGLKHAFRRDDQSGTTQVFLDFLALGTLSATTFCNGTEDQDEDPVRRAAQGNGAVGIPGGNGGDTLCGIGPRSPTQPLRDADGHLGALIPDTTTADPNDQVCSLGLVVSTLIPPTTFNVAHANRPCSAVQINRTAGGGRFETVAWTAADVAKYGGACPDGRPTVLGRCLWPKPPGAVTPDEFGCVASQNTIPTNTVNKNRFDGRIYNAWAKNGDGTTKTYLRGTSTRTANFVGSKYRQHQCRESTETAQIGCFANVDVCTLGFAGYSATISYPGTKALQLNNQVATSNGVNVNAAYPMQRPVYLCQNDTFGSSVGTQSAGFVSAQQRVYTALVSNDRSLDGALTPAPGGLQEYFVPLQATYTKTCCTNAAGVVGAGGVQVTGATACPTP